MGHAQGSGGRNGLSVSQFGYTPKGVGGVDVILKAALRNYSLPPWPPTLREPLAEVDRPTPPPPQTNERTNKQTNKQDCKRKDCPKKDCQKCLPSEGLPSRRAP